MIFSKIWERYFVWELLKTFLLFISTFYGLYVLIDYASHTASFHNHHIRPTWGQLALYYAADFTKRMDVLIPFALLTATIRTLCQFNTQNEWVALLASGVSAKRLMAPFVAIGLFFTALIYINNQFILPAGLKSLKSIGQEYAKQRTKQQQKPMANHFLLEDGSTILYLDYDDAEKRFDDVYWVRNVNEIYRMKTLTTKNNIPIGHAVDHILRNSDGHLTVIASVASRTFNEMTIDKQQLTQTVTPPDELSLSSLFYRVPESNSKNSEKESQLITAFYKKLAMPWLCLLAIIGPAPFCLRFTRTLQVFLIYAFSIFGLVALYLVLDAAAVLGKRQVLFPAAAIWIPMSLFLSFFGWRYLRQLNTAQ